MSALQGGREEPKAEPQPTPGELPRWPEPNHLYSQGGQSLTQPGIEPPSETAEQAAFVLEQRRQQLYIQQIARQVAQQRGGPSIPALSTEQRRPRQAPLGLSTAIHAAEAGGGLPPGGMSMPLQFLPAHLRLDAAERPTPPEQKRKRPAKAAGGRADKKHKSVSHFTRKATCVRHNETWRLNSLLDCVSQDDSCCPVCFGQKDASPSPGVAKKQRATRKMKNARSENKMGFWWRKYGYDGPRYCQRCSEVFRDHIIRQ